MTFPSTVTSWAERRQGQRNKSRTMGHLFFITAKIIKKEGLKVKKLKS
jgi:hypothetical protein